MPVISGSDSRSGYLSLPPRIQLRERDSATGSYPTIARTGDPDFLGNKPVKFDDSRTLIFSDNVTVSYPTLLQPTGQGLKYISGSLATPNSGSDILATGTVRKGVADQFAFFDNSEQIGPFKEHLRVLPNEGAFYLTGTDPNALPGFSSRLGSKTIIKIPMTVKTESAVFWSTGSIPNAQGTNQGVNSGLNYFNFSTGMWDVVGVDASTTTGSAVDYLNPELTIRSSSFLCVQSDTVNAKPGGATIPIDYKLNYQSIIGKPNSTFGFPNDAKFNASLQQTIELSSYINSNFLVEKAIFFFSGSVNLFTFDNTSAIAPHRVTFGIMSMHRSNKVDALSFDSTIGGITSTSTTFSTQTGFEPTEQHKDIVAYGRIQKIPVGRSLEDKQKTELDIISNSASGVTGTFTLPFTAIQPGVISSSSLAYNLLQARRVSPTGDKSQFTRFEGTRDGLFISNSTTGRSTRPFIGQRVVSTVQGTLNGVNIDFPINDPDNTDLAAPYLLTPNDSLIVYVANQPIIDEGAGATENESIFANKYRLNFAPGEAYMLLIGSQIRDGKEFHDTSNQPLNSDAIHEALHFDNPTVDQFQVEALNSYTGSYIDDIVSGDFNAGTRGVVGSSAAGTQGLTGSLIRGVRVTDRGERFYDTVLPDPFNYIEGLDVSFGPYTLFPLTSNTTIYSGTKYESNPGAIFSGSDGYLTSSILSYWWESFPFETSFANVKRDLSSDTAKKSNNNLFGLVATASFMFLADESTLVLTQNTLNKFWYGFGPGFLSSSISNPEVSSSFYRNYPSLQFIDSIGTEDAVRLLSIDGYKYGVKNALPEFSSLVTRYDRYGQFRDMLEQRHDSRFSTGETITDSPVVIRFVNPASGVKLATPVSSSNKSEFATSSLPYFDGTARN